MSKTLEQLEIQLDSEAFPLERYKPIQQLGDGQGGPTYLCSDLILQTRVAVKLLRPVEMADLVVFQKAARKLCRLKHKNIAALVDFGIRKNSAPYVVTTYHEGVSLLEHIKEHGPLAPDSAVRIFVLVAEALVQLHAQEILHHSIHNSNVLIRNLDLPEQAVILLESGAGEIKHKTSPPIIFEGRKVFGKPGFIPPEEVATYQYDARSEVYVLGCVIFEALTGRPPFIGASSEAVINLSMRRSPPSLTQASGGISFHHKLVSVVSKCLDKNPDTRYQSVSELSHALKELTKISLAVATPDRSSAPQALPSTAGSAIQDQSAPKLDAGFTIETAPSIKRVDMMLKDGGKLTLTAEAEPPVRLINAESNQETAASSSHDRPSPSETSPAQSKPDASPEEQGEVETGRCEASAEDKSALVDEKETLPASQLNADSPAQAAGARAWSQPRKVFVLLLLLAGVLSGSFFAFQEISFRIAPRASIPQALVCCYSPPSGSEPGEVDVLIPPYNNWILTLAVNKEQESDFRIGEFWDMQYRYQYGTSILENAKRDSEGRSDDILDAINVVRMNYNHPAAQEPELVDTSAQARINFQLDAAPTGISPNDVSFEGYQDIPQSNIKLAKYTGYTCRLKTKVDSIPGAPVYRQFDMLRSGRHWKIESVKTISEADWKNFD